MSLAKEEIIEKVQELSNIKTSKKEEIDRLCEVMEQIIKTIRNLNN